MIKAWLLELSDREKLILGGGGLLSLAILLHLLLWRPMTAEHERLQKQVDKKQALAVWMSAAAGEAQHLQRSSPRPPASDRPLEQLLAEQVARLRLESKRLPGGEAGAVALRLDNAEFDRVLQLLEQLSQTGVQLVEADLRSAVQPGRVNAQLSFSN